MGRVYILEKQDFDNSLNPSHQILIKELLTSKEENEVIEIQEIIIEEISEKISLIKKGSTTSKNKLSAKGLVYCLAYKNQKCVGYGYGYEDSPNKNVFYIDILIGN